MSFSSPGIYKSQRFVTPVNNPDRISGGGIVLRSRKGPIKRPVLIRGDLENYIKVFGEPYYVSGTNIDSIGGELVPEYGYGSYGAIQFMNSSSAFTLFVVRAYGEEDTYSTVQFDSNVSAYSTSAGVSTSTDIPEVFDSRERISAYENTPFSNVLRVGSIGPGEDGNNYAITIETFNPGSEWLNDYDEPTETSASELPLDNSDVSIWNSNTGGGESEVKKHFPIASKIIKLSVYKKLENEENIEWEEIFKINDSHFGETVLKREPIEVFLASLDPNDKLPKTINQKMSKSIFIEDIINGNSNHIYVSKGTGEFSLSACWEFDSDNWEYDSDGDIDFNYFKPDSGDYNNFYLKYDENKFGILNGGNSTSADFNGGDAKFWRYFENREEIPVSILINTYFDNPTKNQIGKVVAKRRDCIAVNPVSSVNVTNYKDVIRAENGLYPEPSYVTLYSGYSKIRYNQQDIYIPNSIFAAILMTRCDYISGPWLAPAGAERGIINVIDQNEIYSKEHIGKMYDRNINSVRLLMNGFLMWGQKTAQKKATALNRINVRRNLIFISNVIENMLVPVIFETNNNEIRNNVQYAIDSFLGNIKALGGLVDYDVVCDQSNNPPSVIDANQLNVDIYVQPTQTVEFIHFTTIVTAEGVTMNKL